MIPQEFPLVVGPWFFLVPIPAGVFFCTGLLQKPDRSAVRGFPEDLRPFSRFTSVVPWQHGIESLAVSAPIKFKYRLLEIHGLLALIEKPRFSWQNASSCSTGLMPTEKHVGIWRSPNAAKPRSRKADQTGSSRIICITSSLCVGDFRGKNHY